MLRSRSRSVPGCNWPSMARSVWPTPTAPTDALPRRTSRSRQPSPVPVTDRRGMPAQLTKCACGQLPVRMTHPTRCTSRNWRVANRTFWFTTQSPPTPPPMRAGQHSPTSLAMASAAPCVVACGGSRHGHRSTALPRRTRSVSPPPPTPGHQRPMASPN